jgi:Zn-dependent metalloprotease
MPGLPLAARRPSARPPFRRVGFGLFALLAAAQGHAVAAGAAQDVDSTVRAMTAATGAPVTVTRSPATGTVTFLAAPLGRVIPLADPTAMTPAAGALAFVGQYAKAFGLTTDSAMQVTKVDAVDSVGMDHVRLQQLYRGIPVTGAEMTVHLHGSGVAAVLAKTVPDLAGIDVTPAVDPDTAGRSAREAVGKPTAGLREARSPRLEVFNRGLLEGGLGVTRLAWFVEVVGEGVREYVWVDARRGVVLLHFSQLTEIKSRQVFNANSGSTLPGQPLRGEGQPATGDPDADAAYDYSGDTYDYYLSQHGRDSFDGAGAPILSTVHFCPSAAECPYANAAWNGTQMVYGNGFSRADDVDAHELTHAVTERTANLFYYMQSGALNESISDMFGETVDLTNGKGNDSASVRWLMGEDVPGLGAIRNMMNPSQFGDPDRVQGGHFYCVPEDNGGVHHNSGVTNHAYALMVDGGTFNGYTIDGIGLAKAGKVVYRTLSAYLTSGSGFADFYDAMKQSCADLVGPLAGITSTDCAQVKQALDAVDLPNWGCGWRTLPTNTCGGADVPVLTDDMENLFSGNWTTGGGDWTGGAGSPDVYFTGFAKSGVWSFWGYTPPVASDSVIAMTHSVLIPPMARLRFNHAFDFEPAYDGGVVEYSADEGATWHDVTTFDGFGSAPSQYLQYRTGNPLQGRLAFTGTSYGYTVSQAYLDSFEGQRLRFRFRIGTDSSGGDLGWFIDDVEIYNCQDLPGISVSNTSVTEGDVGYVPMVFNVSLSKPFPLPLTLLYETASDPGAATPGEDFVPVSGKLLFPPGTTNGTVSVPVIGDRTPEGDEVVTLNVGYTLPYNSTAAAGTIIDDDAAYAGFTISDVTFAKPQTGSAEAIFTVNLLPAGNGLPETVNFRTVDGTAVAPIDYVATTGTLTFAIDADLNVVTQLPVSVPVLTGPVGMSPRSFYVELSNSSGPPIARARGTATLYEHGLYPVTPCRLLDTREADQGPALSGGSTRIVVAGEKCGIPPSATAVSLNVTVVSPTGPGDLRMFATGSAPLVSTINYSPGQIRANNAVVPLSDRGWLSILCDQAAGAADVIVDVNGFFE